MSGAAGVQRLCIAGLTVDMQNADTAFFARRLRDYVSSAPGPADLTVRVSLPDPIVLPAGEELLHNENRVVLRLESGAYCRCVYSPQSGRLLQAITYAPDYSYAHIELLASRQHPYLTLTDYEYMLTGSVFSNCVAQRGGLVVHSSSLIMDGEAIAFSAPSGTGKSTHTALWQQLYGERVTILNDDKPVVRFDQNGQPLLYGTPWSGKTDHNTNRHAPLRALVFLERQPHNRIRPLSPLEAMPYLMREIWRPFYGEELGERMVDTALRLVQSVPVFLLGCTPEAEAVQVVRQALGLAEGSE